MNNLEKYIARLLPYLLTTLGIYLSQIIDF